MSTDEQSVAWQASNTDEQMSTDEQAVGWQGSNS
jgi:hypothetical protein